MTNFEKLLGRSTDIISKERAERLSRAAKREYNRILDEKQDKIDVLDDRMEQLTDLSSSADLTTASSVDSFDAKEWINEVSSLHIERETLRIEKEIIKEKVGYYFDDNQEE